MFTVSNRTRAASEGSRGEENQTRSPRWSWRLAIGKISFGNMNMDLFSNESTISSYSQNLDNWKSSRRKRQEHIIERVVEVKKLELEEHDRQRRRNKTFSEMMEERGNRGRKLSISLAMYNDEDANDLSDLGIGTSSGKSSVSGDTHDDTHSVLVSIHYSKTNIYYFLIT